MSIDSKTVPGRRTLHFDTLDEVLADAERLVASPDTRTLGNWPLGQLLTHLALAINGSIDGIEARAPWYVRLIGRSIKGRIIRNGMRAGFRLPKSAESSAFPASESPQQSLEVLRAAIHRTRQEPMTARHPVFGRLTNDEWRQLHLRHAELHLSFAVQ